MHLLNEFIRFDKLSKSTNIYYSFILWYCVMDCHENYQTQQIFMLAVLV